MNKKKRNPLKREDWEKHVANWQRSDMTQTEYCRKSKLPPWTFSNWKNKFLKEKSGNQALVEIPIKAVSDSGKEPFLEISISEKGLSLKISSSFVNGKSGL